MRPRRTRAALGALGAAALAATCLASTRVVAADTDPPALPAHAAAASGACTPPPPAAIWTTLQRVMSPPGGREPEYTVDPWLPCRWYRATDPQTIQRSTDAGASWQTVLRDSVPGATSGTFTGTSLQVPAPGTVAVSEAGNGDSLVLSDDTGRTWQLRSGSPGASIADQPILDVVFAPSDARVAYALPEQDSTGSGDLAAPYVTRDGGRTWQRTTVPSGPFTADAGSEQDDPCDCLVVDPADPSHFWMLVQAGEDRNVLLTGSNFGQSWLADAGPAGEVHQMVAIRSARHTLRLIVVGYALAGLSASGAEEAVTGSTAELMVSDDASTWQPVHAGVFDRQAPSEQLIAVDPNNPDRMVMVRYRHHVDLSTDGGDSWTEPDTTPDGHAGLDVPALHHVSHNPYDLGGMPARMVLQPARDGTLFLTYTTSCAPTFWSQPDCPAGIASIETWSRYAPPWVSLAATAGGAGGATARRAAGNTAGSTSVDIARDEELVVEEDDGAAGGVGPAGMPLQALVRVAPDRLSADRVLGCALLTGGVLVSWGAVVARWRRWRRLGVAAVNHEAGNRR